MKSRFLPRLAAVLGIVLALSPAAAFAQQGAPYALPVTVTNSSAQAIGANPARKRLIFFNPSATATIACSPVIRRDTGAALPAAINGAGSFIMLPYGSFTIDAGISAGPTLFIPTAWNCISSAASSPLSVYEFE
jgi:hypothetical protein